MFILGGWFDDEYGFSLEESLVPWWNPWFLGGILGSLEDYSPKKLRCPLKRDHFERKTVFQLSFLRGYERAIHWVTG